VPDRGGRHEPPPSPRTPHDALERNPSHAGDGVPTALNGKVLIVDDEQAIRLVCRVNLDAEGFETLEAADGVEAITLARSERPDLILLDIMLPTLDGWLVAEKLAGDQSTREIPVVFLSARSEDDDLRRGYELGGVGFITKPFEAAELATLVSRTVAAVRRGEREQLRADLREELGED
jgi:two-component system, OmpR family, alkaline phosphatase synthesis response regulator PhoP